MIRYFKFKSQKAFNEWKKQWFRRRWLFPAEMEALIDCKPRLCVISPSHRKCVWEILDKDGQAIDTGRIAILENEIHLIEFGEIIESDTPEGSAFDSDGYVVSIDNLIESYKEAQANLEEAKLVLMKATESANPKQLDEIKKVLGH
ncbi:hypothetical protein NHNEHLNL_00084 [Aeromonas phage avDM1]|uniref:Uncharacterized protein n=1 Tax=Aeromonas phage vB_AehM_DM2 TaxID=2973716 RepID=A0AA94YVE9_9CAUD|nr:hypothetical protein NPHMPGLK_00149 [Aeromonas phage avDM2]UYD60680.1 hypothetical protein NHNEHLNL_00084 [Aeromonas phage avDM2]